MRITTSYLLVSCLALVCAMFLPKTDAFAADRYWVCDYYGPVDLWGYSACWSSTQGGSGGAGVPATGDSVYLTQSSIYDNEVIFTNAASYYTTYPTFSAVTVDSTGIGLMSFSPTYIAMRSYEEYIGRDGYGRFNQNSGLNEILDTGAPIYQQHGLFLGFNAGSTGEYYLQNGALLAQNVYVGYGGTGYFKQIDDFGYGYVTVANELWLGYEEFSIGTYDMLGGTLTATQAVVGRGQYTCTPSDDPDWYGCGGYEYNPDSAVGVLNQTGGVVEIGELSIALHGTGTYHLTDGTLQTDLLRVGIEGFGTFEQTGGDVMTGTLEVSSGTILGITGTPSEYTIDGAGSLTANTVLLGKDTDNYATFTQNGGVVTVAGTLRIGEDYVYYPGSTYNLNDGELSVTTINKHYGYFHFNGGRLMVETVYGDLTNQGGTLAPGNSPGVTDIIGSYTQLISAQLEIEIGGLFAGTEYDVVNVSDIASLGGTLNVTLYDPGDGTFSPSLGDSFDILRAKTLIGEFDFLNLASLAPGLQWQTLYLADAIGSTDVVRLSVVSSVPVPGAVWLMGSGLLSLLMMTRRGGRHVP